MPGFSRLLAHQERGAHQRTHGLEKNREEVIAAGAIIIRTVMEALGMSSVLVSDLGLREGALINLAMRT